MKANKEPTRLALKRFSGKVFVILSLFCFLSVLGKRLNPDEKRLLKEKKNKIERLSKTQIRKTSYLPMEAMSHPQNRFNFYEIKNSLTKIVLEL